MPELYTRVQFNASIRCLGKSQKWFAEQVNLSYPTVAHWGLPRTPFPSWVPLLLAAWEDNQRLRSTPMPFLVAYPEVAAELNRRAS